MLVRTRAHCKQPIFLFPVRTFESFICRALLGLFEALMRDNEAGAGARYGEFLFVKFKRRYDTAVGTIN